MKKKTKQNKKRGERKYANARVIPVTSARTRVAIRVYRVIGIACYAEPAQSKNKPVKVREKRVPRKSFDSEPGVVDPRGIFIRPAINTRVPKLYDFSRHSESLGALDHSPAWPASELICKIKMVL